MPFGQVACSHPISCHPLSTWGLGGLLSADILPSFGHRSLLAPDALRLLPPRGSWRPPGASVPEGSRPIDASRGTRIWVPIRRCAAPDNLVLQIIDCNPCGFRLGCASWGIRNGGRGEREGCMADPYLAVHVCLVRVVRGSGAPLSRPLAPWLRRRPQWCGHARTWAKVGCSPQSMDFVESCQRSGAASSRKAVHLGIKSRTQPGAQAQRPFAVSRMPS